MSGQITVPPNAQIARMAALEAKHGSPGYSPMTPGMFLPQYPNITPNIPMLDAHGQPKLNQVGQMYDYYGRPIIQQQQQVFINQHGQIVDNFGQVGPQNNYSGMYGSLDPFNFRDTQYSVHPREIEKIDRVVARVLRAVAKAPRLFRTIFTGRGQTVFKHHENVDPQDPVMGKDFTQYEPAHEELKEFEKKMLSVHKDYQIGMVAMDASRNSSYLPSSISERTIQEFTALVADFKERMIWRGGDIRTNNKNNPKTPDPDVLGIANSPNVTQTTITATAANNNITSVGDFADAIIQLAAPLIKAHYPTPYSVIVTPGVLIQSMKNRNDFSDRTDLKNVNDLGKERFGIDIVDTIEWTPHLLKTDESNTTGRILVLARKDQAGIANAIIYESYPAWHRPLNLGTQIGIAGKIGWYGGAGLRRENSGYISDPLTMNVY